MSIRHVGGVTALVLGALLAGCTAGTDTVPEIAPLAVEDVDVRDGGWPEVEAFVAAAAAEGRPTVVNLFASWCAPCAEELPVLLTASDADPSVAWLGIASEDPPRDRAVEFVARQGVDWPVLYDPGASTHIALEGRVMPVTALFDDTGELVHVVQGQLDAGGLAELLARVGR